MTLDISELIEKGIENSIDQKKMLMTLAKAASCNLDKTHTYKKLYKDVYGNTLCKEFCDYLVENLHNENEHGRKWTVDQTNELARKNSINFGSDYTEDEFNAAVHLMYYYYSTDIKESGISSDSIYAKMADSFLTNPDVPKGKLVNHFFFTIKEDS